MFKLQPLLAAAAFFSLTTLCHAELPTIRLEPVLENQIVSPVAITNAGDGSNRLFVADQRGTIHIVQDGLLEPTPFLDISSRLVEEREGFDERGLLGLAFHPDFSTAGTVGAGKFYAYYRAPDEAAPGTDAAPINHQSVIAEYQVSSDNSNLADPNSERILMTFQQPQFNHDGGYVGFGPDNMLYISTGDGGSSNDNNAGHTGGDASRPDGVLGNAQDRTNLLGKMLRIDVDSTNGPGGQYGIPADNPFVGVGDRAREEIYAYGLRNPWRVSFDSGPGGTGRLFAADVGQNLVEEINLIEAGGNYGWRIKEGTSDFDASVSPEPLTPLIDPIAQYAHPEADNGLPEIGLSVTGGVVYRGEDFPELDGSYIFGDWSSSFGEGSGTLLALEEIAADDFALSVLDVEGGNPLDKYILAFGTDESGEVYVATKTTLPASALDPDTGLPTGSIYRIAVVPEPGSLLLLVIGMSLLAGNRRVRRN